jgi:upstream activation factor subunit UAF30
MAKDTKTSAGKAKAAPAASKTTASKSGAAKGAPAKGASAKAAPAKAAKPAAKSSSTKSATGKSAASKSGSPRGGLAQPVQPSAALAKIVGSSPLPRSEIVKKMWDYIKQHGLQDAKNKREINADGTLEPIFGKKKVTMFEMNSHIARNVK